LAQLLFLLALNADHIASAFDGSPVAAIVEQIRHYWGRKNTRTGSRRNISSHYDLGNTFYEKWLDPSMTYSSAKFGNDVGDLEGAQDRKYQSLGEQMRLQEGDHVLEIGSGWGGFAEFAAKHFQAKITGLTISKEQFDYASERIFREGLSERVTFKLQDYRDADGEYDKVASIEMFEAVGREYWPTYFQKVHALLKPGGAAGIQVITIADRLFAQYLRSIDFIQRYVFPGGMLPSPTALRSQVDNAGLAWREAVHFGEDYAKTLAFWHERFVNQWSEIQPLGFDERFKKLWRFYLAYCEAGFRAKTTDVLQATLVRT
ncbi:MAG: cyclopropane-fatty-acyl-phospholipid synthase family protein, partial [Pseudomonadota bacterium]